MRQLILVEGSASALADAVHRIRDEQASSPVLVTGSSTLSADVRNALLTADPSCMFEPHASVTAARPGTVVVVTATTGDELAAALQSLVDVDNVTVVAPITDWHFSRRPLFLVTIPKSGTHPLYELVEALGYAAGCELGPSGVADGGKWYCLEFTNSHTLARDFFVDSVRQARFGSRAHPFPRSPTLFLFRHPLAVLVSEARSYDEEGKTVVTGNLAGKSLDERITTLLHDPWLLGSFRDRIGGFVPWLSFPNVVPLSFEELLGEAAGASREDQLRLIWSIMLKLQVPGRPDAVADRIVKPLSPLLNEGQAGAYNKLLEKQTITDFENRSGDLLTVFGYLPGQATLSPDVTAARRRRPLIYASPGNGPIPPLTVREDFLGCNFIRYKDAFYAVPSKVGPVALEIIEPDLLARLPQADTLDALEALLLLGKDELQRRYAAIDRIAESLRNDSGTLGPPADIEDAPEPCKLVDTYRDFNILAYKGAFVALRQSIGEVVLDAPVQDLKARYSDGDVVSALDLEALRQSVDGVETARVVSEQLAVVAARQASLPPAIARLTAGLAAESENVAALSREKQALQEVMARLASEIDGLAATMTARAEDAELLHTIVTRVEDDVAEIRSALSPVSTTLETLSGERDELRTTVTRLEAELAQSRSALASASSMLTSLISEREEQHSAVARLEEEAQSMRSALAALFAEHERTRTMVAAQLTSRTEYLNSGLLARTKRIFKSSKDI
jgi:predicted  nucleic acid-binding Zn-ribbon protein